MCGIEVQLTHQEDAVQPDIVVKPDKNDPFSKGSMCPKVPVLSALQSDPDRLRYPVKRVGKDWVEIPWAEAYVMVEENIKRIRDQYGADAVASYLGRNMPLKAWARYSDASKNQMVSEFIQFVQDRCSLKFGKK